MDSKDSTDSPATRRPTRGLPGLLCLGLVAFSFGCSEGTTFHPNGRLRWSGGTLEDGQPTSGPFTHWYENGERRAEGTMRNGLPVGPWTYWHKNGNLHSRGERKLAADGHAGLREGPWTFWHENGRKRAEGVYKEGLRTGPWTEWHDRGREKSEGSYKLGLREGPWTLWNADGIRAEASGEYRAGERVGP